MTRLLTLAIRVVGLLAAVNALLLHPSAATPASLALAGFMLAGAEAGREFLAGMFDQIITHASGPQHRQREPELSPGGKHTESEER